MTDEVTIAPHKFLENLKKDEVIDPDEGRNEFDLWIDSKCGTTPTLTAVLPGEVALGPWTGKMCMIGCIVLHWRRVGGMHERSRPLSSLAAYPMQILEAIDPGDTLNLSLGIPE